MMGVKMKKLKIQYTIFVMFICIAFGSIILTEKLRPIRNGDIDKKLQVYIEEKYKDLKEEIKTEDTYYANLKYNKKVINKNNNNYYFMIYYENKKITDTYKKDYVEGKTFLKHIEKEIKKQINEKVKGNYEVTINTKLNKFNDEIKEKIIKEDNLKSLKIYNLEIKFKTPLEEQNVTNQIIAKMEKKKKNGIYPKTYSIIITDKEDNTKSVKISGLTNEIIKSENFINIISDIINNNIDSELIKENNIQYEYLN